MVNKRLIYDVGAHKGEDTEFYLKKGFAVVAIEAIPEFCVSLEKKFGKFLRDDQLKILNVAVSKTTGPVDFYINETQSIWGTSNPDWVARNRILGAGKTHKISVIGRPLLDIIKEYGVPWYCKIDIEGNDLDALQSLIGASETPPFVSIESEKRDWIRLMEEFLTFRELGYSRYKIVDQTLVNLHTCPRPAREGDYCDHIFELGSSGLFGDELPGSWLALPEAVEAYRQIFRGYALNGNNGMFSQGRGIFSIFNTLGRIQGKVAQLRRFSAYVNPAAILPPASWYDTHAAQ
jgi:FkbM family methyltransferase